MRTRHTEFSIDDDSRDSIDMAESRISTRSRSRAMTSSPRVILRQRLHQRNDLDRYMAARLPTRSKRKKYSSYPDIEYAAAKRTKQNSANSNQENQEEQSLNRDRSPPRHAHPQDLSPRRSRSEDISCSPRRTRTTRHAVVEARGSRVHPVVRKQPVAISRLKRDLGEGYEEVIEYSTDKPYGLRRERQIVMRYEAPDFREVVHHRLTSDEEEDDDDEEEDGDDDEEEEEEEEDLDDCRRSSIRNYSLRRKPPKVVRYEDNSFSEPPKARGMYHQTYSPDRDHDEYHRRFTHHQRGGRPRVSVRRTNIHHRRVERRDRIARRHVGRGHQSTTSESDDSCDSTGKDEAKFEKRKKKSMNQARARCLPMNLSVEDIQKGLFRERLKAGASMADIDPMSLDRSIDFNCVGGLEEHLHSLREMIVFPMLYPEVFEKFNIAPPRGVIFYGSPGTGKTLVARALANECSKEGQKISFFMRKGADCLSKWVGESERQLRLLFDQAYSMRPSIIFFDEIDGLAPVRSTRQEQIHSSIVSTLLALMDGLDSRGEVVVIGATNRLDAIDPAMRRPGRFDREFHFPLPSATARAEILKIHTSKWSPVPHPDLLAVLADRTAGFCGADLKALVTESALSALRRRYPQIYKTNKRLLLDPASITVRAQDFYEALLKINPAQARTSDNTRSPLPQHIRPLLSASVMELVHYVVKVLPSIKVNCSALNPTQRIHTGSSKKEAVELVSGEPEIYKSVSSRNTSYRDIDQFFSTLASYFSGVPSHRPRLLVHPHNCLIISSLLHSLEELPLHEISLSTLHDPNYRTVEEAASRIVVSASKKTPSILYIPHLDVLESSCNISVCNVLYTLLNDLPPNTAVLLVATLSPGSQLDQGSLFHDLFTSSEILELSVPTSDHIREFFIPLLTTEISRSFAVSKQLEESLEELDEAPPLLPKPLSKEEIVAIEKRESATLRELRLFLRDMVNKIMKERKFYCFCKPVNLEEVSDYLEVVQKPMDLEKIREKIDNSEYETIQDFVDDVEMITENAIEYNPADEHTGRQIRHRAAELKDYLHSLLDAELDEEFSKLCEEMKTARENRTALNQQTEAVKSSRPVSRGSGQNSRNSRHSMGNMSLLEDNEETVCGLNGVSSDPTEEHIVSRILKLLKKASIDEILRLYTLISQVIMKNRANKTMTRDSLIEDHINPILEAYQN